jgi:hypothetical protein
MTVVAHAGHWLNAWIYLVPVLVVVVFFAWSSRKDAGREREQRDGTSDPP